MKRIVLIWMAAFLMGGMAMAQHARHSDKMPEPKVRAERMTERMVKEYSLNDTQKNNCWRQIWHWLRKWKICRCIVPKHTSIIREMASAIN